MADALDNSGLADRLDRLATLLDAAGSTRYAVRAYRRAAGLVRSAPVDVASLVRAGRVRELRGIGQSIEARLRELVETGELTEIAELEAQLSPAKVRRAESRSRGPRVVMLGEARRQAAELAEKLDGVAAGDARRGLELPERHALAVPTIDGLEEHEAIVSVLSREGNSAVVVTTSGLPFELVAGPAGTALVRATGSAEDRKSVV